MAFRVFLVAAALSSASAAAPPAPCCAYSGKGAAVLYGLATIDLGNGPQALNMVIGTGGQARGAVIILVNASSAEESLAGWRVAQNATTGEQTLFAWNAATRTCVEGDGNGFVPGYDMCPGAPNSLFPTYGATFKFGATVPAHAFTGNGDSRGIFLGADQDCALVSIVAPGNPVPGSGGASSNGGAFSMLVVDGGATQPPESFFALPSYC